MIAQAMRDALAPVGIYRRDADALMWELESYADEIERLYAELDELFRERFVSTAENIGLSVYEELFGPERDDLSLEQRREMLRLRMNLGEGDFTYDGICRALDSLGLDYVINEFPTLNRLTIAATSEHDEAQQALILREVSKIVPLHLDFQLTFNTMRWSDIDALDATFGAFDAEDKSWAELDARTPEE